MKSAPQAPTSSGQTLIRPRLVCLGLALLTLLAYLPVYQHRFLFYDDPLYITENKPVQAGLTWNSIRWAFTDLHASIWHPVTWLSHMLDCQLFGLDPGAHHLVNVLWHALNAALVFQLLYQLTRGLWPSAFAAAVFALHPLRVESVAWAAERKDVLSAFFFLLTLLSYFKYVRNQGEAAATQPAGAKGSDRAAPYTAPVYAWYGLALLCFVLGLMSKAMLVTTPFVLLLLDVWPAQRLRWVSWRQRPQGLARVLLEKLPFFLCAVAVSLLTLRAQRSDAMVPLSVYPLWLRTAYSVLAYGDYLLKTICPVQLSIIYPLPRQLPLVPIVVSALVLVSLSMVVWRLRRTHPQLLLGWLWFLGTLVPVIGLVQVGAQSMADRYTYLPHIGLFLALAFEVHYWLKPWPPRVARAALVPGGLVLLACLGLTERQLSYWADGRTLFTHAIAVTGDNAFAHLNLGSSLEHDGQPGPARREYETALRLDPGLPEAHACLADLLNESGDTSGALEHYQASLRLQPSSLVHENLGALLARLGQFEPAMAHYAAAAKLEPDAPRPYYLMGKVLLRQGLTGQAITQFREALHHDPNDLQALVFLARTLATAPDERLRNGKQSVAYAEQANDLSGGKQSFVLDTLAMAYAESGRFPEALKTQEQAIDCARQAGETDAVTELQQRWQLYRAGKAYRENSGAARP